MVSTSKTFGRRTGGVKSTFAVAGAAAAVAMAAVSMAHYSAAASPSAAPLEGHPLATVTVSTAPTELATVFNKPAVTATPCGPRVTMPCG